MRHFLSDEDKLKIKIANLPNLKNVKTHLNLKGINYRSDRNKYKVYIQVKGKTYHLGLYESLEIAKKAYNLAVKKLYGDIGYFND